MQKPASLIAAWGIETAFVDRDGTINRKAPEGDYVKNWSEFEFLPGAKEALTALSAAGLRTVVVTNQRGIALRRMTKNDLVDIHDRMRAELSKAGGRIDAIYYCPHDERKCACRKPGTGMFLKARADSPQIDFHRSVVIGDSWRDMDAARKLGSRSVLIGDTRPCVDLSAGSLAHAVGALTSANWAGSCDN